MTPHLPTNRLTRHLLFWGGAIVLAGTTSIAEDISNSGSFSHRVGVVADLFLARLPTFVVYTYLLTYRLLPLLFRGQFVGYLAGLLLLSLTNWLLNDLLTYSLTFPLVHWLHEELPFQQDTWLFGSLFPGRNFFMSNVIAGLFICVKLFRQWQQKQAESARLEREKLQTELQLLKLQLNPTLLFSTLDRLQPLIGQQDHQAPGVVLTLALFLRYVLYESQSTLVPLVRELTAIEQFVFLQQIVNPLGLDVSLTARGDLTNRSIAPLSLLPIVENAFNQLPANQADEPAWVSIDLVVGDTDLTLKVINPQTDLFTDNSKQLADIEKQLYFHYADTHRLAVWQEELIQVITLTIRFPTSNLKTPPLLPDAIGTGVV
ncbi:MAG: hypothetical protein JWP57_1923 [Spirosoma sp.]|nr:hypothetical protein [Spirosoma sp.]